MKLQRRRFLRLTGAVAASAMLQLPALAQVYPSRPVRLIVPYAPGGPADILGRLVAQKLSELFGKQFYVENIGGAGGNLGLGQGARAPADGHTIVVIPPRRRRTTRQSCSRAFRNSTPATS